MKSRIWNYFLTIVAIPFAVISCGDFTNIETINEGNISYQSENYFCEDKVFQHPTLVFRSDLGNARLIQFKRDLNRNWYRNNPQWSPAKRCQEITERFLEFQEAGIISYLTVEDLTNGTRAICISSVDAEHLQLPPNFVRLLITVINPNDDAEEILKQIKGISSFSSDTEPMNG